MICHMQNPSSIDPLPMHADAVICRIRPTAGRSVCLGSLHWQFPDQKTWVACMLRDAAAEREMPALPRPVLMHASIRRHQRIRREAKETCMLKG